MQLTATDLLLNPDGSVYHLNLLPEDLADTIITVGDPDRVGQVSQYFDRIELKKGKREFRTHTGFIGRKRISVISTGIGTDNIDIVLNELDALVNIDLESRTIKPQLRALDIIRIGTSGALQAAIAIDTILVSTFAIGLDPLLHYYRMDESVEERTLREAFQKHIAHDHLHPYVVACSPQLSDRLGKDVAYGVTLTAPGFYAPQGRTTRAEQKHGTLFRTLCSFSFGNFVLANLEMETAGIYGLAKLLGHRALSVNTILANRLTHTFSKEPQKAVERTIRWTLERLA
ncbi:nucleoside phosphorylase [Olivibacter ginsenosidimutans]|uniref:Nucleoside phosphorylase n=1 Tax=Olivibacter ginsenosidimutans TaxID=1176537 RepID=A0ABP9BDP7_9SPHI